MTPADENRDDLRIENKRLKRTIAELKKQSVDQARREQLLNNALENLHIHQEELRTQNDELIQARIEIEASHHKYQDLYDFAPLGFFSLDPHGKIAEVNLTGAELLGRVRSRLLNKPFRLFVDHSSMRDFSRHLRSVLEGTPAIDTIRIVRDDRHSFPAEMVSTPYRSTSEDNVYCRSAFKDISERYRSEEDLKNAYRKLEKANQELEKENRERKKAESALRRSEQQIRASLAEKEVLLKEIHHRVKNNMQVISSLVALQNNNLQDANTHDILEDITHRVRSMAMVHEKLYQANDLSNVDFADYAESLLNYLWRAHGADASGIRLQLDLTPVALPVNTAVPCGLILNELVSNALKHAFREGDGGRVIVSLRIDERGRVGMAVRDNGYGLPAGVDWERSTSLGLRLVQMLAKQLRAVVDVTTEEGTEFIITFEGAKR